MEANSISFEMAVYRRETGILGSESETISLFFVFSCSNLGESFLILSTLKYWNLTSPVAAHPDNYSSVCSNPDIGGKFYEPAGISEHFRSTCIAKIRNQTTNLGHIFDGNLTGDLREWSKQPLNQSRWNFSWFIESLGNLNRQRSFWDFGVVWWENSRNFRTETKNPE